MNKQSLTIFSTLIPSLLILMGLNPGNVMAQSAASVTWNLQSPTNEHVTTISGNISSGDQTLSNLAVPASGGYSTNSAQRTSAKDGGSDGAWPGDATEVASRYMQFRVAPTAGNDFLVTSVSFYLWANSGSNMRANVYYSTDSTFAAKTQIGSTFTLGNTAPGSPNVSATPNISALSGGAFFLRVYPWYTTVTTGKYLVTKIVTIGGTTSPSGNFITTSVASLPPFMHTLGAPSSSQSYTVSGTTLANDVVVTPPVQFEISTDAGSTWHGNSSPVTLTVSGGSIVGQPVTVLARQNGAAAAEYSGNITHTSVSAVEKDVTVSGVTLAAEPTTQSALTTGTATTTTIDVNASGGNGDRRIIVARPLNAVNWTPSDGAAPGGVNGNYSSATDQGSGNKIVFDGTGSAVTVTGLTPNTLYYFASYEYNVGSGNSQNYDTLSPGTGNDTTQPTTAINVSPSSLAFGGVEINTVSPEQSYSLSGILLSPSSGNITVAAPSGYRVSTTSGSGFDTLIQVPYSSGTLGATTIYVRLEPTAVQPYNGSIQNSGGGASTQNVSVTGSGSAPGAPNEFQAEDGILNSAYVRSDYAGFTGIGYVDIANKTGASLEFLFRRATAASDTVRIYYALGASSRVYAVSLNGTALGTLNFTGTGAWTTWSSVAMVIALQSGVNRLDFAATTNSSDNANIDRIVVGGQSATALYKLNLTKSGLGTVSAAPPSADSLYDAGTSVTLTATPASGYILHHWSGTEESTSNPFILTMSSHKTEIAVFTVPAGFGAFPYHPAADGFASVNALGYPNGTTGGSGPGAQKVYVTNYTDFATLMLRRVDPTHTFNFPPLTVYVIGTLTGSAMLDVKDLYDVSIIGVGVDAKLSGFGLNIVRSRNIIVRNLLSENSVIDGFTVQANDVEGTGDHIWIDHCSVTNAYDGAIDVTHTETYVTLSWNHIYNHDKTCLMGHSDTQTSDTSMKVTYHHMYFDSTIQRHPRVRYGKAHVYNNYCRKNSLYGVSSNDEADVVVEGTYFLDVPIPTETSRDGEPQGDLVERYNIFAGTTGPPGTRGTAFDPSAYYSYALDSASTIPAMLTAYAGSGKFDFSSSALLPPVYSISLNGPHGIIVKNPNQPTYDSGATVQLTATRNTGYHFVNWSGDLSGSVNPQNIVMSSNRSVTANFAINQFTITATAESNGSISPSGAVSVNYGDSSRFTMTPSGGYHVDSVFADGIYQGAPGTYTFYNVQAAHTIRVHFAQNPAVQYTLNITIVGSGSVAKVPDQPQYDPGTVVTLTPSALTAWSFSGWSGDTSGSANPLTLTMTANKNITATFVADEHTYAYLDNWNMVSLPLSVADARTSTLFPTAASRAFTYESVYKIRDTLSSGVGYWIKFNGAQNDTIVGARVLSDTATVAAGWNMIGSVADSAVVGTAQVREIPSGIVTSHYFGYNGAYFSATAIREGKAYWVKANAPGKIVLNSGLPAALPQTRFSDPLSDFSKLTITDAAGNAQSLYLGNSQSRLEASEYDLPPVPPAPIFDARFGSQRNVELYETKSRRQERFTVALQSAVPPLTLKWEMRDVTKIFAVVDEKSATLVALEGSGSAVLGSSVSSLAVTVEDRREIPLEYSLSPNYPNPFNPSTSFVVGLPQDATLSIGIYNIAGQKVRTLMEEHRPGGYVTVQWDGMTDDHQAAGSGVYFVRVASESFTAVRKLVMIR